MWWLLKEPFFDLKLSTLLVQKSKAFPRSEIVSCRSAIFFWSFSSLECWITFSGTLAMKFWPKRPPSSHVSPLCPSSVLAYYQPKSCREARDLSRPLLMLEILKHRVLCRTPSCVFILWNKNAEVFILFRAYRIIKMPYALLSLWLFRIPCALFHR